MIAEVSETLAIVRAEGISATAQVEETTLATTAQAEEMLRTVRGAGTLEIGPPGAEATELDLVIFPAGAIGGAMHSEEAGVDLTDRERAPTAIGVHQAWGPEVVALEAEAAEEEAEEVAAEEAAADGADSCRR